MIKGLTYAILTTPDMARARRFFTEQLGLGTEEDQGEAFTQFTTREGTLWALMQQQQPATPATGHGVELYLLVDDPDAAYTAWRERGVAMVSEPHDEPFGRTFAFRDMDGRVMHAWRPA